MRTFLSHDATAKWSVVGEKARSEIPSSGGWFKGTSFEMSPVVFVWPAELVAAPLPKSPDIAKGVESSNCGGTSDVGEGGEGDDFC